MTDPGEFTAPELAAAIAKMREGDRVDIEHNLGAWAVFEGEVTDVDSGWVYLVERDDAESLAARGGPSVRGREGFELSLTTRGIFGLNWAD